MAWETNGLNTRMLLGEPPDHFKVIGLRSVIADDDPGGETMDHDVLLRRKDGSVRCFRIYDRPTPKDGDIITLPIDGQLIKAAVKGAPEGAEKPVLADAEAV